ncbi:MAG TPA: aminoacetone oxidase family FAD-binding enzyme, partial [Dehalococcoidia bacterium]|nr:aminoacetone oxidase family FAD-binding enzyme [Dehalococcoidia bacterium]
MVEVQTNGHIFTDSLLFTHRGLSGPSMLQISNYWVPGGPLKLNLLPGVDVTQELIEMKNQSDKRSIRSYLNQYLPRAVVVELQTIWFEDLSDVP